MEAVALRVLPLLEYIRFLGEADDRHRHLIGEV